jgi:aspartyl-tRNA(Asn)/glutamyl-tRNA(Gln) amidotransferase subunit C
MEVNEALIDKLAKLSRLHFTDEEKPRVAADLQKMISFVEKLSELDLDDVKPLLHMTDEVNIFRDDEVQGSISHEDALKNAPLHDNDYFLVPKVIKK